MWPTLVITAASALAIPASAIGMGYLRPVNKSRAPGFWIVARILRKRRGQSSLLFLFKHGYLSGAPQPTQLDVSTTLLGLGLRASELRPIQRIYSGLVPDMGTFLAVATCVEIVRNLRANGK